MATLQEGVPQTNGKMLNGEIMWWKCIYRYELQLYNYQHF